MKTHGKNLNKHEQEKDNQWQGGRQTALETNENTSKSTRARGRNGSSQSEGHAFTRLHEASCNRPSQERRKSNHKDYRLNLNSGI